MKLITILLASLLCSAPAGNAASVCTTVVEQQNDEFAITIIKDETVQGVRHVSAKTSSKVCSKQINLDIKVKGRVIVKAEIVKGCPGNAAGVCSLLEGRTVEEAIKKLDGIDCGGRGTSCPDQLARVLKALKW